MEYTCDICSRAVEIVFELEKGIAPNCYLEHIKSTTFRPQTITFCESCQLVENRHSFSMSELYGRYAYRSPNTTLDDEISEYIAEIINTKNIMN